MRRDKSKELGLFNLQSILDYIENCGESGKVMNAAPPEKEKRPLDTQAVNSTHSAGLLRNENGVSNKVLVSWVNDATSTETQDSDALSIVESVRLDPKNKLRAPIEKIRRVYRAELENTGDRQAAKEAVAADKKKLPGVLWSGQFTSRRRPAPEKLVKHSGLLCADLDGLGEGRADVRAS